MSTLITKNIQVGTSGTPADNFTIFQPATPDGTLRIGNGNTGITTGLVTLNSAGNLGIGTSSPTSRVTVGSGTFNAAASGTTGLYTAASGANAGYLTVITDGIDVSTRAGAGRLILDAPGNLGLGVTPSAWGSNYKAIESAGNSAFAIAAANVNGLNIASNAYATNAGWVYTTTGAASYYNPGELGVHKWFTAPSGTAGNAISFTQAMTLDASGILYAGTTGNNANARVHFAGSTQATNGINLTYAGVGSALIRIADGNALTFGLDGAAGNTERARIDSSGNLLVGTTQTPATLATTTTQAGGAIAADGRAVFSRSANTVMAINRLTDDGTLVGFVQAGVQEGSISVSGTTVSYNGGHLSRWAQTLTPKDETLVKGTVLSNLDEMNVYTDAEGNPVENEQLNKVKVSDVEGDANVAGVFVNWDHDEQHNVDEINMAMTGDMIIRIAAGTTVVRGDLLMSAGNGTAKPQGDDIIRSKTIAKVTSTHVTCTYADGSFCVPCVLMAC
jgi:hypothetical protein